MKQDQARVFQIEDEELVTLSILDLLGKRAHRTSVAKGFWPPTGRNKGEMIALMHSELSEMLEGVRKPGLDQHCPEFTSEEIELADLFIRMADYWQAFDLRIGSAVFAKMSYNEGRPYKHGKDF